MIVICTAAFAVLLVISIVQQYAIYKQSRKRGIIGHDALTGLCNLDHLAEKAAAYRRDRRTRLVIYINIAEFKLFNELFGREKGNDAGCIPQKGKADDTDAA